jgi:hypothetical protein
MNILFRKELAIHYSLFVLLFDETPALHVFVCCSHVGSPFSLLASFFFASGRSMTVKPLSYYISCFVYAFLYAEYNRLPPNYHSTSSSPYYLSFS